jgi:predicted permease
MLHSALAIAPVFLIIMLGWAARQSRIVPDEAWAGVNKLAYNVLAPLFMLSTIAKADIAGAGAGIYIGALLTGALFGAAIALLIKPIAGSDMPAYSSVFQTAVRWNAMVLLSATPGLFGEAGVTYVVLAVGPMALMANLLAVTGLSPCSAASSAIP